MIRMLATLLILLTLLVSACRPLAGGVLEATATREKATASPVAPAAEPATPATETAEQREPIPPAPEATDSLSETQLPPTVVATQAEIEGAEPQPSSAALIPIGWDDRKPFERGLVPGERKVLQQLEGATIYHLVIDITEPTLVKGQMAARYTNQETEDLEELVLHLFPQQLGGDMEVDNVRLNGEEVAAEVAGGILRVPLASPLQPGAQTVLALDFWTRVPGEESTKYKVLAYTDNILALAHFYPMFAVYDEDGWHTEPSAPHGDETYADISFYLVDVTAPTDQVLVASGVDIEGEGDENVRRALFAAGPMRDFYLAASDDFSLVQQQVGPLTINSYAPAGLVDGAEFALDVTVHAVESYADRYGPYPYSELDIVSTPTDALGIEYPGVFANAVRIYDLSQEPSGGLPNSVLLESTTAHEAAHQWFYGLVGNDQLEEPWLDESLTQYATWKYFVDRYGEQNAQGFFSSLEGRWSGAEVQDTPIGLPADAYSGRDYGAIVYGRGPIFLHELATLMGEETFRTFLHDYVDEYRWQIATAEDFQALAERYCDCDLSRLFAEEVYGQ